MKDKNAVVWFVRCKPFVKDKRNSDKAKGFQEYCLNKCIFGMGWRPEEGIKKEYIGKEFCDDIANELKEKIKNRSFTSAQKCYKQMKVGDVVFTRLNDLYYVGTIESKPKISDNENFTWYSTVDKWREIGGYTDLPHHVRGLISGARYRGTVAPIENLSAATIKKIAGVECQKEKLNKDNFFSALGDEDLEDIVADYMTKKHKDYVFLPSSCKKGTPLIEYVFYNPENGKQISCQTKVNSQIDFSKYQSPVFDKYEKIYFFSGLGEDKGYINEPKKNFEKISNEDLYETLKNNAYFSEIVKEHFDFE